MSLLTLIFFCVLWFLLLKWNRVRHVRLLETEDEHFDPIRKYHGIWKLYGLALPDDVLKKLYYKNALRIFPGLPSDGFPP